MENMIHEASCSVLNVEEARKLMPDTTKNMSDLL